MTYVSVLDQRNMKFFLFRRPIGQMLKANRAKCWRPIGPNVEGQSGQLCYIKKFPSACGLEASKFNEIFNENSEFSVKFRTWSSSSSGCGGALIRFW